MKHTTSQRRGTTGSHPPLSTDALAEQAARVEALWLEASLKGGYRLVTDREGRVRSIPGTVLA
jgi:hypothetical protein